MLNHDPITLNNGSQPFNIKDCALVVLTTGKKARLLQEFRQALADVDVASIYYHFWGSLLQPRFDERDYNNDFAAWVRHGIHDEVLAERLAVLSPASYPDLETLRREMIELINTRMDEVEYLIWSRATRQFEFLSSRIVVFNTQKILHNPAELVTAISKLSTGSIFYHFIDARRRAYNKNDDFSNWLASYGDEYSDLRHKLLSIDSYFCNLSDLRDQLTQLFQSYFQETAK